MVVRGKITSRDPFRRKFLRIHLRITGGKYAPFTDSIWVKIFIPLYNSIIRLLV